MKQHVIEAMKRIPILKDIRPDEVKCERLGGLTNLVYRISTSERNYCLRIPAEGTEEYIDRAVEKHNTIAAVAATVSPELYFFSDDGLMLSKFLVGSETMTPDKFRNESGTPRRAGSALRKLHQSGQSFQFQFEVFSMIDEYLEILSQGKSIELPDGYQDVVEQSLSIQRVLDETAVELAPCHCDPLCENFLNDVDRMWIVDWEYSGMNDPYWDLGDLSVEAGMSENQELEMLIGYFGHEPSDSDMGRVVMYKALCDLLWTLWGLIQHMNDNPAEDFWAYSLNRFARCRELISSEEFPLYLKAIQALQ